ncbi:MAG: HD-GYP domain-containing protein [Bacillota bacterium]
MILAKLDERVVGQTLGHNIYDDSGRILLRRGVTLTSGYMRRLKDRGYRSVYVRDELAPDIRLEESIGSETRTRALGAVKEFGLRMASGRPLDVKQVDGVVERIVDDLNSRPDGVITLSSIKTVDNYTYEHSVNVCILSVYLGSTVLDDDADLLDLGRGALLHYIGKLSVPLEILLKPSSLTEEEYREVQRHPEVGYGVLRNIFPEESAGSRIAREHHERIDGSGYPEGISGERICEFGRVVAVADVYDAMTSDRVYRDKMAPHEAIRLLEGPSGENLDPVITDALIERVAHSPVGTRLLLSTGELAVVCAQGASSARRPRVRILTDRDWHLLPPQRRSEIELADREDVEIASVLEDYPRRVKAALESVR